VACRGIHRGRLGEPRLAAAVTLDGCCSSRRPSTCGGSSPSLPRRADADPVHHATGHRRFLATILSGSSRHGSCWWGIMRWPARGTPEW